MCVCVSVCVCVVGVGGELIAVLYTDLSILSSLRWLDTDHATCDASLILQQIFVTSPDNSDEIGLKG